MKITWDNKRDILETQTKILEYLKDLYFENLPEEEQTWLVRECL